MTQQNIDFGTGAQNDGENLFAAFTKIQANFNELYSFDVSTISALAALTAPSGAASAIVRSYSTEGDGGGGVFVWSSSNHSAHVSSDSRKGVYVAPTSASTGASGAWVRQIGDRYYLNWFGIPTGSDASTAIQAAVDFVPDGSRIGVIGTPSWQISSSITISQRTALVIQGGVQSDGTISTIPIITWTGAAHGTMFKIVNSGLCFINGFHMKLGSGDIGIDIWNTGVGRIATNCGAFDNIIENTAANSAFIAIRVATNAADNANNDEFHEFRRNLFGGFSAAGTGKGLYFGNSSNAHAHILDTNNFVDLAVGIDAVWLGVRMEGRNNFSSCGINVRWQHASFPCDLGYMDSEGAKQAIVAGACESPVKVHSSRFAGLGNVVTATGLFELPANGTTGQLTFAGNLIGNGAELTLGAYLFDFKGANSQVFIRENLYNVTFSDASALTNSDILHNWNAFSGSGANYVVIENENSLREVSGGVTIYPYINGRWQSTHVTDAGGAIKPLATTVGALGLSTEFSGTTQISAGALTINYGVTHVDSAATPTLSTINIPASFKWVAGQFTLVATQAFRIDNGGNIQLPAGVTTITIPANQVIDFKWDGTKAYPITPLSMPVISGEILLPDASRVISGLAGASFINVGVAGVAVDVSNGRLYVTDYIAWQSSFSATGGSADLFLKRIAAAIMQQGNTDVDLNANIVAQTFRSQGALTGGTTNQAGKDWTFIASPGKGTGAGGRFLLQVAPAGASGSTPNTPVTALTLDSAGAYVKPGAGTTAFAPMQYTSGTNLTSAIAGGEEYDGVQKYFTIDTSSGRGAVPVEQYVHLTADGSTISTIANFFGTTSNISLVASAYYEIEIVCFFLKTTSDTVVWTLTNSSAPTSQNIEYRMSPITGIVAPPGTATMLEGQVEKDTTAAKTITTGTLTSGAEHYARFKIYLQNGSGTSLKIQATSTSGTITPRLGSRWIARRMSPNNIGTLAA